MGDDGFDENSLTEKLSKLNSSQQSIQSFSKWCIAHRKKAKLVVEQWDLLFKSPSQEKRVALLYLANDILQNSRRKGSEFVNEFWKVLPSAMKDVFDSSDDACKKVASRLVAIWEERKVFGSKGQNLRNELFGGESLPEKIPSFSKKPSTAEHGIGVNPVKIVKRDANFVRIKMAVGGFPEKIVTSFHQLHEKVVKEEAVLNECRNAVSSARELEKAAVNAVAQGNQPGPEAIENIQKQENVVRQSIAQLEKIETARLSLFSQLREAVQEQETKVEHIRRELRGARGQIEQSARTRLMLLSTGAKPLPLVTNSFSLHPSMSEEESKKAAAAAVAAKLAASASSAQMLTSVLSSLVAEEAAGLKRPRLETPMLHPDSKNPEAENSAHLPSILLHSAASMAPIPSNQQPFPQLNQLQPPFLAAPQLPLPANPPANQISAMVAQLPYGYGGSSNLQPPLLPSDVPTGFSRPGPPLQNSQGQPLQQQQQQQQIPGNGGYYRTIGVGFYGQPATPTPPVHRGQ